MIFRKSKRIRALEREVESLRKAVLVLSDRLDHVCPGSFDMLSPHKEEQEQLFRSRYEARQEYHKKLEKDHGGETPEAG